MLWKAIRYIVNMTLRCIQKKTLNTCLPLQAACGVCIQNKYKRFVSLATFSGKQI